VSAASRPSKRRVGGILLSGIAAILGLSAGVAFADAGEVYNFVPNNNYAPNCFSTTSGGSNKVPCQTDNASVSYYTYTAANNPDDYSLESEDKTVVMNMMESQYEPTQLTVTFDSTPVYSGSGETDIMYQESSVNMPSTADGFYWCNGAAGTAFECDQGYVRIQGGGYYSAGLSCHETGHAVGLTHGHNAEPYVSQTDSRLGCMKTPVGTSTGLGTNNKDNINFWY